MVFTSFLFLKLFTMKKGFSILLLLVLCNFKVLAQNAYIQKETVLLAIPTYEVKLKNVSQQQQQYSNEIKQDRTNLQKKVNSLAGPYNPQAQEAFSQLKKRMKPTDTLKLNLLIEEDKALAKKEETYNAIIKEEYQNKIQPLLDKLNIIIDQYATKQKLDAIYVLEQIQPAIVYINPKRIITNDIIEIVKKEFK